jgi:hypothetical protein
LNPSREIEINQKILDLVEEIKSLPNIKDDPELMNELVNHSIGLRKVLFYQIARYEYHEYYLLSQECKLRALKKQFKLID